MKFGFNPRTGRMEPVQDPRREIQNAVRRDASIEKGHVFQSATAIRDGLAMCSENGNAYCAVKLNGQWRCIGRVVNLQAVKKASHGPLADFHLAWMSGTEIANPLERDSDSE